MKAVICKTREDFDSATNGAIWLWRFADKLPEGGASGHIMIKCPGCGEESAMHVRIPGTPHPKEGASWEISGLPDAATMTPSIHHSIGCCGWHGYLTKGEYAKC